MIDVECVLFVLFVEMFELSVEQGGLEVGQVVVVFDEFWWFSFGGGMIVVCQCMQFFSDVIVFCDDDVVFV